MKFQECKTAIDPITKMVISTKSQSTRKRPDYATLNTDCRAILQEITGISGRVKFE